MLRIELPEVSTPLPGPKAQIVLEKRKRAVPNALTCANPLVIERGEGAMLKDVDGNRFLDWVGGIGVLNIGYSHPEVIQAVKQQSEKFFHGMMAISTHEGYIKLAEKLNEIVPVKGDARKTMLVNCGAEAVENAVKIAKAYTKRPNIIVFSGAYHGRTSLTMAMTAKKSYSAGMGPFPEGVHKVDFPYIYRRPEGISEGEAIKHYIKCLENAFLESAPADSVAAVILEPIQGEGGFVPAPMDWIRQVRSICDKNGILLVVDEVQTGFARTGRMFASDYWKEEGFLPDILACAKSIAGGMPLGAVTASEEIMDSVPAGVIGGTFCGNAVACAAALKVIEVMERSNLPSRSLEISEIMVKRLNALKERYEQIGDIRNFGCMLGIEFVKDQKNQEPYPELVNYIIKEALSHGLLIANAGLYGNVIRFLAPLVMTDEQLHYGLDIFENAVIKGVESR